MVRTIRIYGASDDLIEVEGGALTDEGAGPGYVELSTGDVFRVDYDGCWNVTHHVNTCLLAAEDVRIVRKDEEDDDGYTGHALVTGPIEWIDFWQTWPPRDYEMRERVSDRIDELDGAALRDAYAAITGRGPVPARRG